MNNTREILLAWLLIGVLSLMAYGSGDKLVVLSGEQSVRRVVPDIDGGIWVLKSRSPLVLKYSSSGSIVGGFDVSAVPEPLLSPVDRRTVYDISTDPEGRLLSLVGVVDPATRRFSSFVLRFGNVRENPEVVRLDHPIAGYKFGVDRQGRFHILGLGAQDLVKAEIDKVSGEFPVVHRFTGEGTYLGSGFPVRVDASSQEAVTRTLSSPLHHEGNFVVSEEGEAWVLWMEFPSPREADITAGIPSKLYRVDADGHFGTMDLKPPFEGFFVSGLLRHAETGEVIIDWKGRGPSGMLETVLSTSDGAIVTRGDYSGRIVALTGREVLSSIRGMIEGQVSLLSQALE
jgi:hypothetical protein